MYFNVGDAQSDILYDLMATKRIKTTKGLQNFNQLYFITYIYLQKNL
jgi:hypothetical protein